MLSSRAPEVTCPVVKDLLFLHLGNCQRSLQAFHPAGGIQNKAGTSIWLMDKKISGQMTHLWRTQTKLFRGHDFQESSVAGIYLIFKA